MGVPLALLLSLYLPLLADAGPSGAWLFNPDLSETEALGTVDPTLRQGVEPIPDLVIRLADDAVVF